MHPTIIVVANHKGGVGKTTIAANLALRSAELNLRTIAIDLDAQGNLSRTLVDPNALIDVRTALDLFDTNATRPPQPIPTFRLEDDPTVMATAGAGQNTRGHERLTLVPAHPSLTDVDGHDMSRLFKGRALIQAYDADVVVIDTPPQLTTRTLCAIISATLVVCPFQAEKYSLEGLEDILNNIAELRTHMNPGLLPAALVPNMVQHTSRYHETVLAAAREAFGHLLIDPALTRSINVPRAQEDRRPVWHRSYAKDSAAEFRAVSEALLQRAGLAFGSTGDETTEVA